MRGFGRIALLAAVSSVCSGFSLLTAEVALRKRVGSGHLLPWHLEAPAHHRIPSGVVVAQLSLSSQGDDDDDDAVTVKRQNRVNQGFRAMAVAYLIAIGAALIKSWTASNSNRAFVKYIIIGPLVAAGMAQRLAVASVKDKLATNTHKGLSLCLIVYGMMNMLLAALTAHQFSNPFWLGWALLAGVTTVNSFQSYVYGVKGWVLQDKTFFLVKNDFPKRMQQTMQAVIGSVPSNLQSQVYLGTTVTLGTLFASKVADALTRTMPLASQLSRLGLLWLLTGASLILKAGADRCQLEGMTQIHLNFLLAYAFGAMSIYMKSIGIAYILAGTLSFFGVMCALFGVMGLLFKREKENYHDSLLGSGADRLGDDFPFDE